jgi:hypothetical protein
VKQLMVDCSLDFPLSLAEQVWAKGYLAHRGAQSDRIVVAAFGIGKATSLATVGGIWVFWVALPDAQDYVNVAITCKKCSQ